MDIKNTQMTYPRDKWPEELKEFIWQKEIELMREFDRTHHYKMGEWEDMEEDMADVAFQKLKLRPQWIAEWQAMQQGKTK